jgi:hypothetical protein
MATTDGIIAALKTFNSAIDKVLCYPAGPKRWRAANNLWLSLSYKHREEYAAVVKENADYRAALGPFNKFAQSNDKNSGLRSYLNIPAGAYYMIQRADPNVFRKPENNKKFFNEFKEYTTAEAF